MKLTFLPGDPFTLKGDCFSRVVTGGGREDVLFCFETIMMTRMSIMIVDKKIVRNKVLIIFVAPTARS